MKNGRNGKHCAANFLNAQTKQQFRETVQHPVQIMKKSRKSKKRGSDRLKGIEL